MGHLCDSYNDTVANNSIRCQGDNLVFGLLTYETYDTLIENNSILAIGTSELYPYYETICIDGVRSISELSKTYGVILDFSSDNQFIHNDIEVTSTVEGFQVPYNPSVNILIGLYIYYDSNRNNISENNVYIHGHDPFLYGMGSSGDDTSKSVTYACENIFSKNNITIEADYFAMGMILRHNSQDTLVKDNYFRLDSNNYTYGITLEISDGSKILNNTLNSTSKAGIYAIEGYAASNNDISYNKIYSEGSFSTIALYASNHNNITHNLIRARGSESQDPAQGSEHPDSVKLFNTGISLQQYTNDTNISDNDIEHNAPFAVDVDETCTETTVANNILSASAGGGNNAINDRSGKAVISGNTGNKYHKQGSNEGSKPSNPSNSQGNSGNSIIHTNGTSSYSGNADSSGSSALGQIDLGLIANALSSLGEGIGDAGGSESGDTSDLMVSEIEEIASKTLSGIYVPIVALILMLVFCFSFLGAKNEDDDDEE